VIAAAPVAVDHAHGDEPSSTFVSLAAPPKPHAAVSVPAPRLPPRLQDAGETAPDTRPLEVSRPPSGAYRRGAGLPRVVDPVYEDETETKREAVPAPGPIPRLDLGEPDDELSTAARRFDPALLDANASTRPEEADAANADRTVPPPAPKQPDGIEIDVSFDDNTEQTLDLRTRGLVEDDETETMELSPELRARVDQLMATRPAPVPVPRTEAAPPPPRDERPRRRR
jgi:hypothetical protein